MTGNPALIAKIRARIAADGPLPFRDFMAAALYDPEHGYYTSGRAQIGRAGDFFTNVSVGPLFGQMLAMQFEEMWERLGRPHDFRFVEQGANTGDFARDVMQAVSPEFRAVLHYTIIEPVEILRARQRETLRDFAAKITWCDTLANLAPFCGIHFSNELIDAFPVHLVRFTDGEWRERCIGEDLALIDCAIRNDDLLARLRALPRIEDYETEIGLDAVAWAGELTAKLTRGYVLAIDYGWPREIFYAPQRTRGTLTCYAQHRRSYDPMENIGEADLTAHVDFTSLAERFIAAGFALTGFTDQHHFMTALAKYFFATTAPNAKQSRALQTLIHPQFLGTTFKILAVQKSIADSQALRGFEFASDARAALGLA